MHRRVTSGCGAGILCVVGLAASTHGQLCPPGNVVVGPAVVRLETIADSRRNDPVEAALALVDAGDGRMFMANRFGRIYVIEDGVIDPIPSLDISASILADGNRGLTGLALHKDFNNPLLPGYQKIYVHFTQPRATATPTWSQNFVSHQNVLTEWVMDSMDPNRVNPASQREIFRADHRSVVHMGGDLKWGPDGYLYVAIGGPINRHISSQENDHPDGTIMRIDPLDPALTPMSIDPPSANGQYRVPSDNPFVGVPNVTPEVWAYGLRHQWRMSFDALSGNLFTGDVGHASYEEINHIVRGGNYGWPYFEGQCEGTLEPPDPPPAMLEPLVAYSHDDGVAVIGGYVYRGASMPNLRGKYLFADLSREGSPTPGRLMMYDVYDQSGQVRPPAQSGIQEILVGPANDQLTFTVHSLAEDMNRELYLLGVGGPGLGTYSVVAKVVPHCWADCDQSTGLMVLDIFDFLCFGNFFTAGDPYACNCDTSTGPGACDIFDFLCFGNAFGQGCE